MFLMIFINYCLFQYETVVVIGLIDGNVVVLDVSKTNTVKIKSTTFNGKHLLPVTQVSLFCIILIFNIKQILMNHYFNIGIFFGIKNVVKLKQLKHFF